MTVNRRCIIRLSRYKNALVRLKNLGFVKVFSDNLADAAGVNSAQVRKDFSIFGLTGNKRGGYRVDELLEELNRILGKDRVQEAVIAGVGNIGAALLQYNGFEKEGIKIRAGFEIDPSKFRERPGVSVLSLEKMGGYIRSNGIEIGIIAVPDFAAQQVLEIMVNSGIRGVLNFAPIRLRSSSSCIINSVNLVAELENVIYFTRIADKNFEDNESQNT